MKFFNLFLVFFFLFFIGCGDVTRVVPESNTGDPTNPTDDPTNPTDDPTNPTDDPTNPTDDPTNPTDDPTNPTDDNDDPTNDEDSTEPTNDNDDPTNDEDSTEPTNDNDGPEVPTDQEKCANAGGTWDYFAEEDFERCYKIVNCAPKPANTEWRGDQSYTEYYDVDDGTWTNFGANYKTEYNEDGEAKICQYICAADTVREDNTCKPLCSAVFDGSSSRIEVSNSDLLNLGQSWTIEAWVKQDLNNLTTESKAAIARKGDGFYLTGFYKSTTSRPQATYYNMYGGFYYTYTTSYGLERDDDFTAEIKYQDNDAGSPIEEGWNHVALSYYVKDGTSHLRLYINGKLANEKTDGNERTPKEVGKALTIGYYYEESIISGKSYYFNGKIDQLKISENCYENEFTPSKLSADGDTIAFWDFNNNYDETKNGLESTPTNVTFSTDCAF